MSAAPAGTPTAPAFLKPVAAPSPWEAYVAPVAGFPLAGADVEVLRGWLPKLSKLIAAAGGTLRSEIVLQVFRLNEGGASSRVSDHAAAWQPEIGLGVWPDRPPPTGWTQADFENLEPGQKLRKPMHQVLLLGGEPRAREQAVQLMLGTGALIEMLTPDDTEKFTDKCRSALFPRIEEKMFKGFPFYLPLLEAASIARAPAAQLESWLGGAQAYIRESSEDSGVLILSRRPLGPALTQLGFRAASEPEPGWRIPT